MRRSGRTTRMLILANAELLRSGMVLIVGADSAHCSTLLRQAHELGFDIPRRCFVDASKIDPTRGTIVGGDTTVQVFVDHFAVERQTAEIADRIFKILRLIRDRAVDPETAEQQTNVLVRYHTWWVTRPLY